MRQFFNIRISFIILKKKTSFLYDSNVIHQLLYLIKTINGSSLYSLNGKIKNTVVFNFQVIQGGLNPIKLFHLFILLQKALDSPINESRLYRIPNPHNSLHFLKIAFHVFKVSHILSWREREPVGCPIPVIPASFLISPQFSNGLTNKWFLFFFFQILVDYRFVFHQTQGVSTAFFLSIVVVTFLIACQEENLTRNLYFLYCSWWWCVGIQLLFCLRCSGPRPLASHVLYI